jgi:glycosyltransferase involved in cell wall biosynthesis
VTRRVDFPARGRKYARPGVHFIAISSAIARILVAGGAPPSRIALVPSGIELPPAASPDARTRLRREWDAPGESPVFGMVGSYVDHKDPVNLVQAAERLGSLGLADFRVVLVGEGELRAELEAAIAGAGLTGRVILAGWRTDVRDCMEAMDVFVMPSKLEGLCTSLLDAQAVGLPCVACAAGGIPDIITDGDNGWLVPPRDPGALAGAMAAVWADPSERRRRAARGPAVVAERFTVERMVEGTLAVYHGALGSA